MFLREAAIVKLIMYADLRVEEILQLRMSDVILDGRKGGVIVREWKGSKRREIPLSAKARKALLEYLRMRPNVENEDLFIGQRNDGVQRFAKKVGLKHVTPHILCHSFAKAFIDAGVSLEKVATLLGHSNLNTTRIYTTPGEEDLEDAVREAEM